ncbi:MAG: PAS domain-containing protein, partial [Hyphococcus sp.]
MSGALLSSLTKDQARLPVTLNAFVWTAYIVSAVLAVYVCTVYLLFGQLRIGMVIGACASAGIFLLGVWARRAQHIEWPARLFLVTAIVSATVACFFNGGADSYLAPFLIVAPIIAGHFLGARSSVFFGVAALACVGGLHIADVNGLVVESPFPPSAIALAAAFVLVASIIFAVVTSSFFASRASSHSSQIEESRALLASMADVAGVGGWELPFDTMQPVWTDQTHAIHDVGPDFVPTFQSAVSFYAPEARSTIETAVQECIDKGKSFDVELPLTTAKGRDIWVRAVGRRIDENGAPVKLVGAFQDITAQRKEREALAAALECADQALSDLSAYQAALDQNAIVAITDTNGRITFANEKFSEV